MCAFKNTQMYPKYQQKSFSLLQQCNNHQPIIQSWAHVRIHPIIEEGIVTLTQVDETVILNR